MLTPKEQIISLLLPKLAEDGITREELATLIDYPKSADLGDYTLACFVLAKKLRKAPPIIAKELLEVIEAAGSELFSSVEAVGGYLNFRLSDASKTAALASFALAGDDYGKSDEGAGKTIVLDFSSPNIAKPFHIGHLGTTAIGNSLRRMHEFCGYKTVSINHLGDWGTQFGRLIVAYRRWGSEKEIEEGGVDALGEIYRRFYAEAEEDPALNDEARAAFAAMEAGDPEALRLWQWFKDISLAEFQKTYKLLNIDFDSWNGEAFYNDKMDAVIAELEEKNLLTSSDGAKVVDLSEEDMPPCLILKSDGSTLYATRDITAGLYRKNTYDFHKAVYVTDAGQSLHFKQWFTVIGKMGYEWSRDLVHVPYGKLSINGTKLASRTGNVILLRDLFADAIERVRAITLERNPSCENVDEVARAVGVGALVFHQLSTGRIKDISFSVEEALNFDGSTGPYVQYTHARICSVLRKEQFSGKIEGAHTFDPKEQELYALLVRFPETVAKALADYEPSTISRYALDLCQSFNRFYQACSVLKAEGDVRNLRLAFCTACEAVLKNCLWLLGMEAPETI